MGVLFTLRGPLSDSLARPPLHWTPHCTVICLLSDSNLVIKAADPSPLDVLQYRDRVLAGVEGGACENQIRELALKSPCSWVGVVLCPSDCTELGHR